LAVAVSTNPETRLVDEVLAVGRRISGEPRNSPPVCPGNSEADQWRSLESARTDHTCTPGLGIGHRTGGPLPGDRRRNGSSSPPRRSCENATQLPRDLDLEMRRSRPAVAENVLRSL